MCSLRSLKCLVLECSRQLRILGEDEPTLSGLDHILKSHKCSLEGLLISADHGVVFGPLLRRAHIPNLSSSTEPKRLAIPEDYLIL